MRIKSVAETILHDLRVKIIVGAFPPGLKLKEEELSSVFGVSRGPLREALRMLESEHLVKYYPRRGCYVTEISLENCREIYQVRLMMESFSVDMLKANKIKDLPKVESALEETVNLTIPASDDAYKKYDYLKAIANFHISLVDSARNAQLSYFYRAISPNLARYQSIYTYMSGLMDESYQEHKLFLDFIKNGHYKEAKNYLRDHINKFVKIIEKKINDEMETTRSEYLNKLQVN